MDDVAILAELRALAADQPWTIGAARSVGEWTGRLLAVLEKLFLQGRLEKHRLNSLRVAVPFLVGPTRSHNILLFQQELHAVIATLEFDVSDKPGTLYGPGAVYDAMRGIREVFASANSDLLVVDPYLDADVFDVFVSAAEDNISLRLLSAKVGADVVAARNRFAQQRGREVLLRTSRELHDRLFFVDERICYVLGQSMKDASKRSPTYIAPLDPEISAKKYAMYLDIWNAATPV